MKKCEVREYQFTSLKQGVTSLAKQVTISELKKFLCLEEGGHNWQEFKNGASGEGTSTFVCAKCEKEVVTAYPVAFKDTISELRKFLKKREKAREVKNGRTN